MTDPTALPGAASTLPDQPERSPRSEPLYSTYELEFMTSLRESEQGRTSLEQLGITAAAEDVLKYTRSASAASLFARGLLVREGDRWVLSQEPQVVGTVLTTASRWLGIGLVQGKAVRASTFVQAKNVVLLLTQEQMECFSVRAVRSADDIPQALDQIATGYLRERRGAMVSLRLLDEPGGDLAQLMVHVGPDGEWRQAHEPKDENGNLAVEAVDPDNLRQLFTDFLAR